MSDRKTIERLAEENARFREEMIWLEYDRNTLRTEVSTLREALNEAREEQRREVVGLRAEVDRWYNVVQEAHELLDNAGVAHHEHLLADRLRYLLGEEDPDREE